MALKGPLEGQLFIVRAETRRQHTVLFNLSWELAHRATQNVHSSVHVHDHESTVRKWIHQHCNLQIIWITHSSTNGNDSHHNFHKLIPKNVSEVFLWLKSIQTFLFLTLFNPIKRKPITSAAIINYLDWALRPEWDISYCLLCTYLLSHFSTLSSLSPLLSLIPSKYSRKNSKITDCFEQTELVF